MSTQHNDKVQWCQPGCDILYISTIELCTQWFVTYIVLQVSYPNGTDIFHTTGKSALPDIHALAIRPCAYIRQRTPAYGIGIMGYTLIKSTLLSYLL